MRTGSSAGPGSVTAGKPDQPLAALAWMASSALAFSTMAVYIKRLTPGIPQFELVFFRSAVNLLWVLGFMLIRGDRFWPESGKRLLVFRGLAGFSGVACMVYSIGHLPLPIATMLNWCSPLFVILISRAVLKERMPPLSGLFLPIAFAGLLLLLEPFGARASGVSLKAALAGVGAAAFGGMAYVAVRAAAARTGVNTIVLYFTAVSTLVSAPFAAADFRWPSAPQWKELLLLGTVATFGQLTMTQAYRFARAGVVSMMNLLNPVFGVALGIGLFHEGVGPLQWVGIFLVMLAIAGLTELANKRGDVHQKDATH